MERKGDNSPRTRFKGHPLVGHQAYIGAGDLRYRVVEVDLDDVLDVTARLVDDLNAEFNLTVCRPLLCFTGDPAPGRLGVRAAVDGWEPVSRGMPTGRCPDGLTVPSRTSAMACPPSWPGKKVCTMDPALSAKAPRAYGRPDKTSTTTGVLVARRASISPACSPGSCRSDASQPSPDVPRPNSPALSPTTTTTTSAAAAIEVASAKPSRPGALTSQPLAKVTSASWRERSSSRTVRISTPRPF